MKKNGILIAFFSILMIAIIWGIVGYDVSKDEKKFQNFIEPSDKHPQYWSYLGKETLLLGGSIEDNLFQIDDLKEHLELLKSCGGNYVRNTMSSRDEGNVWPFVMNENSLYNLDQWNDLYWQKFNNFLELTSEYEIIIQIEIWATFDFYRDNWLKNPFNPQNNVNYTAERSKLPLDVPSHPIYTENNFFRSIPGQMSLLRVLEYQQKFVDKILSFTLGYDHILYCMDNETSVTSDWGKFWAEYIRKRGKEEGKVLQTTEMWDPWDLDHIVHRETFDHPEIYTFVDISQNNHNSGEKHWENGIKKITHLKNTNTLRPCNNVKIYGNDGGRHQTTQNGIECFIRNVMFGAASARFHRPPSGQGLNEIAQSVIRSVRLVTDEMDFFNGEPLNDVFKSKGANMAYCRGIPGKEYLIYFTDGGEVQLSLFLEKKLSTVRWMNILESSWMEDITIELGNDLILECPGPGHWFVLIQ